MWSAPPAFALGWRSILIIIGTTL